MNSAELNRLDQDFRELLDRWNKTFFQGISEYYNEQISVFESIRKSISDFYTGQHKSGNNHSLQSLTSIYDFHTSNLSLLKKIYAELKSKNELKEFTTRLKSAVLIDIQSLPEEIIIEYNANARYPDENVRNNPFLRKTEDLLYRLRSLPRMIRNWFAGLFNGKKKPLRTRYHIVYYRQIVKGFLLHDYIAWLQSSTESIQKQLVDAALGLFEQESRLIDLNYLPGNDTYSPPNMPDLSDQLNRIEGFYSAYRKKFITLLEKSGTFEFPLSYIRYKANLNFKNSLLLANSAYRMWDSTCYALYEDWRFREYLFGFIANVNLQGSRILTNYKVKLKKTLTPAITAKRDYLNRLIEQIPEPGKASLSDLKSFFTTELYKLQKETQNQHIVEELNKTHAEIEKLLQKIEYDIGEALEKMPEKAGVVRSPDYRSGIRKSEIYFFSPVEFLEFESVPPFINKVNAIIGDFSGSFSEIVNEFSDFDQIIDFSLDAAVFMIEENSSPEQIVLMTREGMKRSLNILDHITRLGNELTQNKEKDLDRIFTSFADNVKKLDDNDSILSIYSSLLKSKVIQESKGRRKKIVMFFSSQTSMLAAFVKRQTLGALNFYKGMRRKLKLEKASVFVSSEISNYLSEINKRIFKLPVVYRYLFENTPVKEENLFLSRDAEIEILNTAFRNWREANYAATLLVGENGGGKSSLLNRFIDSIKVSLQIRHFTVQRFYHTEGDFYELIQDIFENENLKTDQDILDEIHGTNTQQIIVIDGLERLFLRKPGGFACIQKLLSYIVSTNAQIFWICSVSQHAYAYLNKTISLKENYDYQIELNNLSSEQIKNIVLKRHRLSGYLVKYEDDLKQKGDQKNTKARQSQLELEFFNELNRFADSNLSLSLCYWLESVAEFSDQELIIKRFKTPDFSFLETLSSEKIYTLLLIILHGKISIDLHAAIFNQSVNKSRKVLTILKEDSIVVLKGDYYMINTILFKHVVQLLKNKNLIH